MKSTHTALQFTAVYIILTLFLRKKKDCESRFSQISHCALCTTSSVPLCYHQLKITRCKNKFSQQITFDKVYTRRQIVVLSFWLVSSWLLPAILVKADFDNPRKLELGLLNSICNLHHRLPTKVLSSINYVLLKQKQYT